MPDQQANKIRLLEEVIQATETGHQWMRMPGTYATDWGGRRLYVENLRDEPQTFLVTDGQLNSPALICATARESAELATLIARLDRLIEAQFADEDRAGHDLTETRARSARSEAELREAAELERLLSK